MRQIKKRRLCLMLSMLLILWPAIPAFASADAYQPTLGTTTLLAGADRYATAAAIAREGWNQSAYAILVSGENYPDALVAAPLAGKYDAPIILSLQAQLPEVSQQTLLDLQVQKVFLVGGSGVLSDELMSELQAIGIATQRLAGSALAAHRQAAICLIGNDSVSNATFTYLANKPSSTRQSFILGGQAIYSSTAWSTIQGDLAYSREAIAEAILESSRGGSTISAPPSSASDPLTRLGNNRDKYSLIFGSVDSPKYESAAEAAAHMVTIPVNVWHLNPNEEKTPSTLNLTIHQAIADQVQAVFNEIFAGAEQFPIYDVQGYSWRNDGTSEHNWGLAIDINPNENYQIYADGRTAGGIFWDPETSPYSIPEDGDVVLAFRQAGFSWGGNAWHSSHDYMHFSYLGS